MIDFRPFGKEGTPLTWSRQSRRLKPIEDFTIEEMFEIVKHDVLFISYYNQSILNIVIQTGHNVSWDIAQEGVCVQWGI